MVSGPVLLYCYCCTQYCCSLAETLMATHPSKAGAVLHLSINLVFMSQLRASGTVLLEFHSHLLPILGQSEVDISKACGRIAKPPHGDTTEYKNTSHYICCMVSAECEKSKIRRVSQFLSGKVTLQWGSPWQTRLPSMYSSQGRQQYKPAVKYALVVPTTPPPQDHRRTCSRQIIPGACVVCEK